MVSDHGAQDLDVFALLYSGQGHVSHSFGHSRAIKPQDQFLDVCALHLTDGHRVGWIDSVVHSTEPVFRCGCYWVREGGLAIRKLQKEGVIFFVHNICELAIDDAGPFVKVLSDDYTHVFEGEKLLDVILEWD